MTNIVTDQVIIDDFINRRLADAIPSKDVLRQKLLSGQRLRLYQGFDPSSPNLHIGHLVGLLTLKQFQDLGHEVIFLIGDFTGMIGDPSGKLQARKVLTREDIQVNAQTYQDQAGLVLNFGGDNPVQLKFNSTWNQDLKFDEVIKLATHFTVQQMIERDMFQVRLKSNQEIFLNEFLYPLVQGFDSAAMDVDIEVGGQDQLFNMLAGRKLVRELNNKEKLVVTTPLLVDEEGKKIGKTEGNAINIANPPEQLFGQIMSLPDSAIMPCFKLATLVPTLLLNDIEQKAQNNPMESKKDLAWEIVKMLYGEEKANIGREHFERTVQGGEVPDEIPTFEISKLSQTQLDIASLLVETGLAPSKSHARRLVEQGAVKVDEQALTDPGHVLSIQPNILIKAGKRSYCKLV